MEFVPRVFTRSHITTQPGPFIIIFQCDRYGSTLWGISVYTCVREYMFRCIITHMILALIPPSHSTNILSKFMHGRSLKHRRPLLLAEQTVRSCCGRSQASGWGYTRTNHKDSNWWTKVFMEEIRLDFEGNHSGLHDRRIRLGYVGSYDASGLGGTA